MSRCYFHFSLFCLLGWLPRIVHTEGFCPLVFVLQKFLECLQMSYCKVTALRTTITKADARSFLKLSSASSWRRPCKCAQEVFRFHCCNHRFLVPQFSSAHSHCDCNIYQWGAGDTDKKKRKVVFFSFLFQTLSWNHPSSPSKGFGTLQGDLNSSSII